MKRFFAILLALLCVTAFAAGEGKLRIAALKGPTAMGMAKMMDEDQYEFLLAGAVDEISPLLLKGEIDIAAVPANLAANLYAKTNGKICALAVNTLGVLYIVETGESVHGAEDLRGKTIFASGKGATPEYALRYVLEGHGIDPDRDVSLEWKSEHTECLAALLSAENAVALLPQPFVTAALRKAPSARVAIDLNDAWEALGGGSALLTGVLAARSDVLSSRPDEVARFMEDYAESVRFTNEHPAEAAELIGKAGIIAADVAAEAIPACHIVCLRGEEMKSALSGYLTVLYGQNPAAVGGTLPDEDFYR